MLATTQRMTTTGPRFGGSRFFASPPCAWPRAPRSHDPRPAHRSASRKLASGFLRSSPAPHARKVAAQAADERPACTIFSYQTVSGYTVAPNSLDPYATSASGSGAPQVKAPDYPVMLGGVGYPTRDAAGIAGSVGAKQHTTAAREFGGEIYSYQENGVTKYGYMAPRPGGANVTQNGNTYHPGPNIKSTNVPYGSTFVGGYHAHYDGQSFSDPDIYAIASKVSNPGGNLGLYVGYDSGFLNNKIRVDVVVATTPAKGGGWNTTTTKVGVIK